MGCSSSKPTGEGPINVRESPTSRPPPNGYNPNPPVAAPESARDSEGVSNHYPPINVAGPTELPGPGVVAPDSRPPRHHGTLSTQHENEPAPQQTRLVIGIDYGTTHSGVAYALAEPGEDLLEIKARIVRGWPGNNTGDYTSTKVSSDLAYAMDGSGTVHWGFDIPEELPKLRWVKLLLEPNPNLDLTNLRQINETRNLLLQLGISEIEAAAAYLRCIWDHAKAQIIGQIGMTRFDFAQKTIVLTVPAVWSPKARNNTYLVAEMAGLQTSEFALRILSEPEAAAIAVLRENQNSIAAGECFVVCDAGGGTVDLISYEAVTTTPFCLKEMVVGDGALCGSVFLDLAFKKYLRALMGHYFESIKPHALVSAMHQFEQNIKRQFVASQSKSYFVQIAGVPDIAGIDMEGGRITITRDALKPIFEPVCGQVEGLIYSQVSALEKKGLRPKAVLLVGGFGSNKHLYERLANRYSHSPMLILQPDMSWESVSNGAVHCELMGMGELFDSRLSRHNFGMVVTEPFRPGIHAEEDKAFCQLRQKDLALNQVTWFVNKGDEIRNNAKSIFPFRFFHPDGTAETIRMRSALVLSDEDPLVRSKRKTDAVRSFVSIDFILGKDVVKTLKPHRNNLGIPFYNFQYEVEMTMGPAALQYACRINGIVRGSEEVTYYD